MDTSKQNKATSAQDKSVVQSGPEASWSQGKSGLSYELLFDSGYSANATTSIVSPASDEAFDSRSSSDFKESLHDPRQTQIGDSGLCIDSGLSIQDEEDVPTILPAEDTTQQSVHHIKSASRAEFLKQVFGQDQDGDTLLHLAIIKGSVDAISQLIACTPHPDLLDIRNHLYQTPIILAALTGQSQIIRSLILAGATVDLQDRFGNTAVHVACEKGDIEVVRSIFRPFSPNELRRFRPFRSAAEDHLSGLLDVVHQMNYEGQTCIHLAAKSGNKKLLEYLLSCGADMNVKEGKSGWSILHWAVASKNVDMVHCLLTACRVDTKARDYAGLTPLRLSQKVLGINHRNIARLLGASEDSALESEDSDFSSSEDDEEESAAINLI